MSAQTTVNKTLDAFPWTARQKRMAVHRRQERKHQRKAARYNSSLESSAKVKKVL